VFIGLRGVDLAMGVQSFRRREGREELTQEFGDLGSREQEPRGRR
jgi:hypothetical protein